MALFLRFGLGIVVLQCLYLSASALRSRKLVECAKTKTLAEAKATAKKTGKANQVKSKKLSKAAAKVKAASTTQAKAKGQPDDMIKPSAPGAGMDAAAVKADIGSKIYKDGFFHVGCLMDGMQKYADKHSAQGGPRYAAPGQVSVVWYHEMFPEDDIQPMKPSVCYDFCRTIPRMGFFGLKNGRDCYCTPYYTHIAGGGDDKCDMPCEGFMSTTCGGLAKSDVYEMHVCANTAEDLADGLALAGVASTFAESEGAAAEASGDKLTELGVLVQKVAALSGDSFASNAGAFAAQFGGEVKHAGEAASGDAAALKSLEDSAPAEGASFTAASAIREAEDLIDKMIPATKAADASGDAAKKINELATPPVTDDANLLNSALLAYKPITYFVGDTKDAPSSSCQGAITKKPIVGYSKEQCAAACDKALFPYEEKCMSFQYFEKSEGESICLLMSMIQAVNYYTCPTSLLSKRLSAKRAVAKTTETVAVSECYGRLSEMKGFAPQVLQKFQRCFQKEV